MKKLYRNHKNYLMALRTAHLTNLFAEILTLFQSNAIEVYNINVNKLTEII